MSASQSCVLLTLGAHVQRVVTVVGSVCLCVCSLRSSDLSFPLLQIRNFKISGGCLCSRVHPRNGQWSVDQRLVCLCVTYGASVRPEKAVTYSAGNEGQNNLFVGICLKRLRLRVMPRNMSEKTNMLIKSTEVTTLDS